MEDRLNRLEIKIDSLSEAVVSLARVEERLITVFNRQSSIESKVEEIAKKVDDLGEGEISSRMMERIIWIILVAAIGAGFSYLG